MNVSLTPKLEALVQAQVESGRYNNASEVIREALRLYEDHLRAREVQLNAMHISLAKALDAANAGEVVSAKSVLEELDEIIESRVRGAITAK